MEFELQIKNLELRGNHGFYTEENEIGNVFFVNLKIVYRAKNKYPFLLNDLINYEDLYLDIKNYFKICQKLLENLLVGLAYFLKEKYQSITSININISKKINTVLAAASPFIICFEKKF